MPSVTVTVTRSVPPETLTLRWTWARPHELTPDVGVPCTWPPWPIGKVYTNVAVCLLLQVTTSERCQPALTVQPPVDRDAVSEPSFICEFHCEWASAGGAAI